ncbi:MAG: hypothetical protein JO069_10950, partial [Verrucomicrobia bacterium]|nr:hypothetical protein [Verrucomicrobiota bacterium]
MPSEQSRLGGLHPVTRTQTTADPSMMRLPPSGSGRRHLLLSHCWFVLVALVILLSRLWTVSHYGVQEPAADSFNELVLYADVQRGDFGKALADSFVPHNEHHIPLTHWLNIALFLANQHHWDLLLQASVNAFLAAACALAVLYGYGWRRQPWAAIALGLAVGWTLGVPYSFENILWGFQSVHFLFIFFSLIGIYGLTTGSPFTPKFCIGLLAATLACFSLGSGAYVALAVAITRILTCLRRERRNREYWITLGLCALIVVANIPFVVLGPTGNSDYRARSIQSLLWALLKQASWPNIDFYYAWFSVFVYLPISWLIFTAIRARKPLPRSTVSVIGLGIWNMLLLASLAVGRAAFVPYVRYFDYYAFNLIVCACACIEILRWKLYPRGALLAVACVATFVAAGALFGGDVLWSRIRSYQLPDRVRELRAQQQAIRTFYQTGDVNVLKAADLNATYPFNETWYQ